jgi:hypothetical protein
VALVSGIQCTISEDAANLADVRSRLARVIDAVSTIRDVCTHFDLVNWPISDVFAWKLMYCCEVDVQPDGHEYVASVSCVVDAANVTHCCVRRVEACPRQFGCFLAMS